MRLNIKIRKIEMTNSYISINGATLEVASVALAQLLRAEV